MRVWWGEVLHKAVLDSGGSWVYHYEVQESLNFMSVKYVPTFDPQLKQPGANVFLEESRLSSS